MSVEQRAIRHMQRARELLRKEDLGFGQSKHPPNAKKKTRTNQTKKEENGPNLRAQLQHCKSEIGVLQDEVGNESAFSNQTAVSNGVLLDKLRALADLALKAGADKNQVQNMIKGAISENNKIKISGVQGGAGKKHLHAMVKSAIRESRKLQNTKKSNRIT